MADKVEFDEGLFRKAAQKTGHVHNRIEAVLDTLEASINARGKPWGTDTIGHTFEFGEGGSGGYKTSKTKLVEGGHNMAGSFENFSTSQTKSANFLRDMENGNRDGVR